MAAVSMMLTCVVKQFIRPMVGARMCLDASYATSEMIRDRSYRIYRLPVIESEEV